MPAICRSSATTQDFLMAQRCVEETSTMGDALDLIHLTSILGRIVKVPTFFQLGLGQIPPRVMGESLGTAAATEGVFAQLDERKRVEVREIARRINSICAPLGERIYKRLMALIEDVESEYPAAELVSPSSVRSFEKFLKINQNWAYPNITISPAGNILAEWRKDNQHHVAVEFLDQATAKLIMLVPDITVKTKTVPVVTKPRVESIGQAIKPYNILSWVTK